MENKIDIDHPELDSNESKDGRSRTWMILTYEDNDQFKNIKQKLADLDWDYAGRIHDQEKKPHYHIVVLFKNGRKINDVAQDLGIETRWLVAWDKKKRALRYLCHKDDTSKFQYSPADIFGTLSEYAMTLCSKGDVQSESQSVVDIITLLDSFPGEITYRAFISKCAEEGLFSVFRRMGNLGTRLIDEHNACVLRTIPSSAQGFKNHLENKDSKEIPFDKRVDILEKHGFYKGDINDA